MADVQTTRTRTRRRTIRTMSAFTAPSPAQVVTATTAAGNGQASYTVVTYTVTTGYFLGLPAYTVMTTTVPIYPNTPFVASATGLASSATATSIKSTASSSRRGGAAANTKQTQTTGAATLAGQAAGSDSNHHNSSGISGGATAAAVIVPIVVIAAIILGVVFCLRRRKQHRRRMSQASTAYNQSDMGSPEMTTMAATRVSMPPNLNHIVPGELEKETEGAAIARKNRFSNITPEIGPNSKRTTANYSRKPVAATAPRAPVRASVPQIGDDFLRPMSYAYPTPQASPKQPQDPFATPTPGSTMNSTPEDVPSCLNESRPTTSATAATPANGGVGLGLGGVGASQRAAGDELFMPQTPTPSQSKPDTGAVGRHWHSVTGSSRFNGRDPRKNFSRGSDARPKVSRTNTGMSQKSDDVISELDEDEEAEIGEAQAAAAQPQRASVIDMHKMIQDGSSPRP